MTKHFHNITSYISIACFVMAIVFTNPKQGFAQDVITNNQANDSININNGIAIDSTINTTILTDSLANITDTTAKKELSENLSKKELREQRRLERQEGEKPTELEYYGFSDSLKAESLVMWTTNHYFNTISPFLNDTTLSGNHTELPYQIKDVGATHLGVTGSATLLHNYFKRETNRLYPFADPYNLYILTPDNLVSYNTKRAYSDLSYYTSGNKRVAEENIRALLTRNVSPAWNLGLLYQRKGAKGSYLNQGTSDKSFSLFTSYLGERYVANAGYIYNAISNKENGGIFDDNMFTDTTLNPGAIDVNLKGAANKLRSNTYFLTHSYGVPIELLNKNRDSLASNDGTMVFFGHSFEHSRYRRVYSDTPDDVENNYYNHYYLSKNSSSDSTFFSHLNNKVFIKLQPWSSQFWISGIDAGIGYRFENYYVFNPDFYLHGKKNKKNSTAYVYGGASGVFRKYFQWNAFLNYHLSGMQQNDLLFDASARVSLYPLPKGLHFQARFVFDNREQAYFTQKHYSNHAKWDNNFDKTQETKIMLSLSMPDWSMEAGFNNSLINKPIYYGIDSLPHQSSDVITISSVHVDKNFRLGLFRFDHRLLMQFTSDKDVIPLPLFSGNIKYYIESEWVKSVLNTQVGFDVYYNAKFYDYAYNPAIGMFHTQNQKKLGNYPWIELFANFQWKRANIYVKFTNAAEGMIGERDYFSALHYPRNKRMLRWGLRWRFYN